MGRSQPHGLVLLASLALGCGGSPSAPSLDPAVNTLAIDGRAAPVEGDFSQAFDRGRALNWIDISLGSCGGAAIVITLEAGVFPPRPGVYAIVPEFEQNQVSANAVDFERQQWVAGPFDMGNYCGRDGVPPCDDSSPGSGSLTLTSASSGRVSGSYRFVMTRHVSHQGPLSERPPPPTKLFEGTFDVAFDDRALCG